MSGEARREGRANERRVRHEELGRTAKPRVREGRKIIR